MKIVLVLFFAFVLIVATLQADAERLTLEQAEPQLLSDANLGRKVNVGANDVKGLSERKATDVEDDKPDTITKGDSSDSAQRYMPTDNPRPIKNKHENENGLSERKATEVVDDKSDTITKGDSLDSAQRYMPTENPRPIKNKP